MRGLLLVVVDAINRLKLLYRLFVIITAEHPNPPRTIAENNLVHQTLLAHRVHKKGSQGRVAADDSLPGVAQPLRINVFPL